MANQFRNFCITLNNPEYTDGEFFDLLKGFEHLKYFVFQRERGEQTGTEHFQLYIEFTVGKRFDTMKNLLPRAHIESRKGSKTQARDYCMKTATNFGQSYEFGDFVESGERSDLNDIIELVKDGATNNDILCLYPTQFARYGNAIDKIRQIHVQEKYRDMFRKLDVVYLYGAAGVGKSRYVMEKHGYRNVYRCTNYGRGCFDGYSGEPVIVFEEFRSSFKIENMLNYLDGYPLNLPCRYNDKIACYDKVYLISNIEFNQQYTEIQKEHPETWHAFSRRVNKIFKMTENGLQDVSSLARLLPLGGSGQLPF